MPRYRISAFGAVAGHPPGHHKRVVFHCKIKIFGTEPSDRHGQAVGVIADFFDVVRWIALRFLSGSSGVHKSSQTIKADGCTEKWSKINGRHNKNLLQSKVNGCGSPTWANPVVSYTGNPIGHFRRRQS